MPQIEWKRVRPLTDPASIDQAEEKYAIKLSPHLKALLLCNNGGYPKPNGFPLAKGEEYEVKTLLSFNNDDPDSFGKIIGFFLKNYHGNIIPFAKDSGDNYFCEQNGEIVLWLQESGEIIHASDSIEQFIGSLMEI